MSIAAQVFLSCLVLAGVVVVAALVEVSGSKLGGRTRSFFGALVVVVAVGIPVSALAWIWGW